jgi:hypothetical protein
LGLFAQAAAASANAKKPASLAARTTRTTTFVIPLPPWLRRYRTCRRY